MANLINIHGEPGANIVGDGTEPALLLRTTSTGPGLQAEGLVAVSTASIDVANIPQIDTSSTTGGLLVRRTVVGNMSIGVLRIQGSSVASGAVLEFTQKGFISITSTVLTTVANTDYAIRVQVGTETRWIPLFKDAAIVGSAAF